MHTFGDLQQNELKTDKSGAVADRLLKPVLPSHVDLGIIAWIAWLSKWLPNLLNREVYDNSFASLFAVISQRSLVHSTFILNVNEVIRSISADCAVYMNNEFFNHRTLVSANWYWCAWP